MLWIYEQSIHSNIFKIEDLTFCDDIQEPDDFQVPNKALQKKKPTPSSLSSTRNNYQEIVSLQETDGSFKSLPDKYKSISKKKHPAKLEALVTKKSNLTWIWMTILALAILERNCQPSKGEWIMIAKKAKAYLKKNGVADFSEFVQLD